MRLAVFVATPGVGSRIPIESALEAGIGGAIHEGSSAGGFHVAIAEGEVCVEAMTADLENVIQAVAGGQGIDSGPDGLAVGTE